jgi:D-tyrosyl-tRNA(Tyr) deacylase
MRVVIQRVSKASVSVDNEIIGDIKSGLLVLLGFENSDTEADLDWIAKKIVNMRIFADENGKMNLSLLDLGYEILLVSQFTLYAATKKGNRPSYIRAAKPEIAVPLYDLFIKKVENIVGKEKVSTGKFGAMMQIKLVNDGPVTIFVDSKNKE